ncbi:hypothetical protein GRJ2_001401600 [Grus japonensis]|uniref:Uncharacterized protein n=1 Tax=Grus japonensis TaxID=30415 RepID=A0ABC9WV85_GRUJA
MPACWMELLALTYAIGQLMTDIKKVLDDQNECTLLLQEHSPLSFQLKIIENVGKKIAFHLKTVEWNIADAFTVSTSKMDGDNTWRVH